MPVLLVHTEVDPALEGQGLGVRLVAGALADLRARGLKLVPLCPFVRAYLRRHPEDADLVGRGRAVQVTMSTPREGKVEGPPGLHM